ncbi:ArgS-related anticodon-binding protein NrtL [Streptomyces sp. NPDC048111]|uniref:ArgS-related anticodon-binding protein NrtL n=1 Tax=Streptomyces sp. NPDC048111 TaxID=3365500 RepID=UPI00371E1BC0
MTPAELSRTVVRAVRSAVDAGALGGVRGEPAVKVERPRPGGGGDYASGIALKLAAAVGLPARQVAEELRRRIAEQPGIALVEISGPGFLNITLERGTQYDVVGQVLDAGVRYGHGSALAGEVFAFAAGEERARVVSEVVAGLLRAQGAQARVVGAGERGQVLSAVPCAVAPLAALVGEGAARWAVLRAARHDRPRTDVEELLAQRESSALFRVRYAHSRSRALTRGAHQLGFRSEAAPQGWAVPEGGVVLEAGAAPAAGAAPQGWALPDGGALLGLVREYPAVLEGAARHRAPDRLARHLEAVADELLRFQHTVLPLGDEKPSAAHRSRLALAEAAGTVLAGGLSLLGIDAPEFL